MPSVSSINWDLDVITVVATSISAFAAVVALFITYLPHWKQRKIERKLKEDFGADTYPVAVIENATKYYVPPDCSSVDPSYEAELRNVVATKQKLFEVIDNFFLNRSGDNRYLILLADSGMGKTSAVLNYYARNQRRTEHQRHRLAVVPLGIPNADEKIKEMDNKSNTIIFLDAFDEDTKAISDHRKRQKELMELCREFKGVLITCRTQFFPSDEEIPTETGIVRVGPRAAGEKGVYKFYKLYLLPLDDGQVDLYLKKRYSFWQRKEQRRAKELVDKVPLLSARPMLLAHMPDLAERDIEIKYSFELYEAIVEAWLDRESSWVDKDQLRTFSELIAVDLYINRVTRGEERVPRSELTDLTRKWNIDIPEQQLSSRSLLNRDAAGNLKFSHRSIMEYFCVRQFLAGASDLRHTNWTDQMVAFLREMINERDRLPEVSAHLSEVFRILFLNNPRSGPISDLDLNISNQALINAFKKLDIPPSEEFSVEVANMELLQGSAYQYVIVEDRRIGTWVHIKKQSTQDQQVSVLRPKIWTQNSRF